MSQHALFSKAGCTTRNSNIHTISTRTASLQRQVQSTVFIYMQGPTYFATLENEILILLPSSAEILAKRSVPEHINPRHMRTRPPPGRCIISVAVPLRVCRSSSAVEAIGSRSLGDCRSPSAAKAIGGRSLGVCRSPFAAEAIGRRLSWGETLGHFIQHPLEIFNAALGLL